MYEEHDHLDRLLGTLADTIRAGNPMLGCQHLAEFTLRLDRLMRSEERALAFVFERLLPEQPSPLAKIRSEHTSLRELVGVIAAALDRADLERALDLVSKLRSVLLLHVAKEERLAPATGREGHV